MNRYTIYCTEEQTKKAIELGAPIETTKRLESLVNRKYISDLDNYSAIIIPTVEQMIGWLEDVCQFDEIDVSRGNMWYFDIWRDGSSIASGSNYTTRKEAAIAAIDAALDYLIKNKK